MWTFGIFSPKMKRQAWHRWCSPHSHAGQQQDNTFSLPKKTDFLWIKNPAPLGWSHASKALILRATKFSHFSCLFSSESDSHQCDETTTSKIIFLRQVFVAFCQTQLFNLFSVTATYWSTQTGGFVCWRWEVVSERISPERHRGGAHLTKTENQGWVGSAIVTSLYDFNGFLAI